VRTMNRRFALRGSIAAMLLAGLATVQAGPVTDDMLAKDPGDSWLHANGNWAGHRYSTLTQINDSNAKDLKIAWIMSPGAKNDMQGTPLYHDGLIFIPIDNKVLALDAGTGRV